MSSSPTRNFHPDGTLFIVSGPSGAGKTTLINRVRELLEPLGITLYFSVSHTTRPRRGGEQNGVDYHFVSRQSFEDMIAAGEFLEWAHVHEQLYGTSKGEVQSRLNLGEDVILDIDYQGAKQIAADQKLNERSLSVFIFPPSIADLEERLKGRGLNTPKEIRTRVAKAIREIDEGKEFYDYIIINDDLTVATESLKAAIIAEKLTTKTALAAIQEMAGRFREERDGRIARGR